MGEVQVVNASPLITRVNVGRLDLLTRGGQQFVVLTQVADEVLAEPERDPARRALEGEFGAPFHSAAIDPAVLDWSMGAGESAVLSAARSMGAVAILDDQDARIAARSLGVRLTGTFGMVIQSAREGHIRVMPFMSASMWIPRTFPARCAKCSMTPWPS